MFLFAHMGLTYAAIRTAEKAVVWRGAGKFAELLDYRIVFLGSMMPDLIDKPLGGIILREVLGNGRVYSHTLLFLLVLLGAGIFFWNWYRKPAVITLAGGVFFHDVLDGMWLLPETFLWPAFGWSFPKGEPEGWLLMWLKELSANSGIFLPEIFGLLIMLWFVIGLVFRKQLRKFITTGRIS